MSNFPSRRRALSLVSATGLGLASLLAGANFGLAQTADPSPANPAGQPPQTAAANGGASDASGQPQVTATTVTDSKGRHLAPHDTFYLLKYVSQKTEKGVEGFNPGEKVQLVEVHHPTRTLVVSNGRAQIEVPPADLTNDEDIAALVRQKDQANQDRVAAYVQAEAVAARKAEIAAAESTAKDLEQRQRKQADAARATEEGPRQPPPFAQQQPTSPLYGYFQLGGDGYGSPYSYFAGGAATAAAATGAAVGNPGSAPAAPTTNVTAGGVSKGGVSGGAASSSGAGKPK